MSKVLVSVVLSLIVGALAGGFIHKTFSAVAGSIHGALCADDDAIPVLRDREAVLSYLSCTK